MTKENELLNFFKVTYANYPIDKNYLYKLVKEMPEIITAFDPHRSGYYPASSSYIKWWMSYLNCSDNDCCRYFNYQNVMASITNTLNDAGDDFTYRFCNINYKILENIVSVPCVGFSCKVQYHLSDALLSKISHETELIHPELFLKLSDAATLNRLPVDYILRCYDRIINPSSQILKKVSCVQNLPIHFIEQRPSRLNWQNISMYHNIDPDFIRRFASRIYWENIGNANRNIFYDLCLCKKPLEEVQPFVKYDSRYIRQHISDWFIDEYFSKDLNSPLANYKRRINVYNAIFIEKLLQEMYEKDTTVNFELFCEKHIDLFFTLPTGCIKQLLKAYDFSKAFIFGHMESFKSKKCGKAAKESLNIK